MDEERMEEMFGDSHDVTEIEFVDVDQDAPAPSVEAVEPPSTEIPVAAEAPAAVEASAPAGGGADERVAALEAEVAHLRELYLRKLAEFDNFRKRIEREKAELRKTAAEDIVTDLLPVLDNFERALAHSSETAPEAFKQGVEMISRQLLDVLERRGLERFDPTGRPFEPEFHEAIQRVEDGRYPPGTVVWVLSPGYRYGGRLLRAAMVGVSVAPRSDGDGEQTNGEARPGTEEHEVDGAP